MNCKPGDLAIVIGASDFAKEHIGKIVECVRLNVPDVGAHGIGWETNPHLFASDSGATLLWRDQDLRPIRPNDGEDEMIRIAGKPHDTHKSTPETA